MAVCRQVTPISLMNLVDIILQEPLFNLHQLHPQSGRNVTFLCPWFTWFHRNHQKTSDRQYPIFAAGIVAFASIARNEIGTTKIPSGEVIHMTPFFVSKATEVGYEHSGILVHMLNPISAADSRLTSACIRMWNVNEESVLIIIFGVGIAGESVRRLRRGSQGEQHGAKVWQIVPLGARAYRVVMNHSESAGNRKKIHVLKCTPYTGVLLTCIAVTFKFTLKLQSCSQHVWGRFPCWRSITDLLNYLERISLSTWSWSETMELQLNYHSRLAALPWHSTASRINLQHTPRDETMRESAKTRKTPPEEKKHPHKPKILRIKYEDSSQTTVCASPLAAISTTPS
ncbi:hypothetical protein B0H13DRAFT_1869898 [Mycena leptocephala]|nr:hypothetical protein B0H13DRAFT_1869898 [Mycena leptocephala]